MRSVVPVTLRPLDILVFADAISPIAAVACEGGSDARLLSERLGCHFHAIETTLRTRRAWTSVDVAAAVEMAAPDRLRAGSTVLPYAASREVEAWARRHRARVLAPKASLKHRLDDKLRTRRALARRGLRVPDHFALPAHDLSFAAATARLGLPFVVQALRGSGGVETVIVRDSDQLCEIAMRPDEVALVSRHAGDVTFNVNGAVTGRATMVATPSLQAVGIPELVTTGARYCGNDFSVAALAAP